MQNALGSLDPHQSVGSILEEPLRLLFHMGAEERKQRCLEPVSYTHLLKAGGFLTMDEDFFLRLTDIGREVAEQTYEKHCFFTRLLVEAGVEPKTAEQEACCMEHVISENSFRHLKQSMDKKK